MGVLDLSSGYPIQAFRRSFGSIRTSDMQCWLLSKCKRPESRGRGSGVCGQTPKRPNAGWQFDNAMANRALNSFFNEHFAFFGAC
jgi:hypothetical protein